MKTHHPIGYPIKNCLNCNIPLGQKLDADYGAFCSVGCLYLYLSINSSTACVEACVKWWREVYHDLKVDRDTLHAETANLKEKIASRDLNLSHCHAEIERLEESNHTLRLQLPIPFQGGE